MAQNQGWYVVARQRVINGATKLPTDALGVLLVDNTYGFSKFHEFVSSVSPFEITAPSYSRKVLSARAFDSITSPPIGRFASDSVTQFGNLGTGGNPIGGVVIFRDVGANDSERRLLTYYKLPETPTNGGPITINWTYILHLRAKVAS